MRTVSHRLVLTLAFILTTVLCFTSNGSAQDSLDQKKLDLISKAVFEVLVAKPTNDSLTYEAALPLHLLPYAIRTDKFYSIGTAFAIGPSEFVSAAHVANLGVESQFGEVYLRDRNGKVYSIDKIMKFSERRDFIVFSLKGAPVKEFLPMNTKPQLNQRVFAVGNALGEGIVVRDGLYTSDTPEYETGEWKYIRFSAAASPGSSGGPLLDREGNVIGIVLRKSPNENLNYALPISEVMDAKAGTAVLHKVGKYVLDNTPASKHGTFTEESSLPKSYQELDREILEGTDLFNYSLIKSLFMESKSTTFPNGRESEHLLHSVEDMPFPRLITKGEDGAWQMSQPKEIGDATLASNGRLRFGTVGSTVLLLIHKPDNITYTELAHDSKLFMDTVLKGFPLHRSTGSEKTKITSMSNAREEYSYIDSYDRKWLVKTWLLEFIDSKIVTFCLPVPGGLAVMMKMGQTGAVNGGHVADLKILSNFIALSYEGTLKEWQEFLSMKDLLPGIFSGISVTFEPGTSFAYKSKRVSFLCPSSIMTVSPDTTLKLRFGYFKEGGRTVWDVVSVSVGESKNTGTQFTIRRHARPSAGLGEQYQVEWNTVIQRKFPFNNSSYFQDKATIISTLLDRPGGNTDIVAYSVSFAKEGKVDQQEMDAKLGQFMKYVNVCLEEGNGCSYSGRADAYHDSGDYYQAVYDPRALKILAPRTVFGYTLRGQVYVDKGAYDSAFKDYYEAVRINRRSLSKKFGEDFPAFISGAAGEFRDARGEIERIFKTDPFNTLAEPLVKASKDALDRKIGGDVAIHLFRGAALRRLDMLDQSFTEFDRAINGNPGYHIAYDMRGLAQVRNNIDGTIADYTKAIQLDPSDVIAYNRRGVAYDMKKEYDKAIADYDAALKINPSYFKALTNKGAVYHMKKQYDQAIANYDAALRLYPQYHDGYRNRALTRFEKGQYELAIQDAGKAIDIDPKSPDAYVTRGDAYSRAGKYDSAITDYNKTLELYPRHEGAYVGRGNAYFRKGDYVLALSDYSKAIDINPKSDKSYFGRALCYTSTNNFDKAISDYTRATEINPEYFEAFFERGQLHERKANLDLALYDYQEVLEINQRYALGYVHLGFVHLKKGNHDQAISDCTKAIEIDSAMAEAYRVRGVAYWRKQAVDLAKADFDIALRINPGLAAAYFNRGSLLSEKGAHEEAISDLGKALQLNPKSGDAYVQRGLAYGRKGDYELALVDFNRGLELNRDNATGYVNRGYTYLLLRKHNEAITDFSRALEIDPKFVLAYINRGNAYHDLNEKGKACSDWQKACEFRSCGNLERARNMGLCK